MSRYTSAYSGFVRRLYEIDAILRMAKEISFGVPTFANATQVNALCRSGVVLLSSHIEGFIEDLGEIAIDRIVGRNLPKGKLGSKFRYYLSHDIIRKIKQSSEPEKIESHLRELWTRDDYIWDNSPIFGKPLPSNVFIGDFINPTHSKITKFFKRFGYNNFEGDLAGRLSADYPICVNMLNQVVEQRNKIAHGDIVTTGTPTDLESMKMLVKKYCHETDDVFSNWFRQQGCPIR